MLTVHWILFTLLFALLIVPSPALAETGLPAGTPDAGPEIESPARYALIAVPPPAPPDAPARQKVIDKKFIAVAAVLGGAETLRFTTHQLVLEHEYAAGAPWVTSVPSGPHITAKYGGIFAAELLVAYELKKPHDWLPGDRVIRKFWWVYPAAMIPIHIKNGTRSIRTQAPAGCPVADCEMSQ